MPMSAIINWGLGVAAFDFTKIGSEGGALNEQEVGWSATGNEAEGSRWRMY